MFFQCCSGKGTVAMMNDPEVIAFLADRGSRARYGTSVCTGSLVLGVAGLLKGYKARIKGEKIPAWMDAMTMDYPVKDAKDWQALRPNEVISATVEVRDTDYATRDVKPVQRSIR